MEKSMVKTVMVNHRVGGFAKDLAQSYLTGLTLEAPHEHSIHRLSRNPMQP